MSASETYQVAKWDEWTSAISVLICTPFLLLILIVHAFKVWQDLFTTERKSVGHRRHKPAISPLYKLNAALTVFSIFGYMLCSLFNVLQGFTTHNETQCRRWHLAVLYAFMLSKLGLYLQFIARLHQVYGQSAHGYSKRTLVVFAIILAVVIFVTMLAQALVIKDADIYQGYEQFPNYCHFIIFTPVLALMALTDFLSCIASLVAFLVPLRRTLKQLESSSANVVDSKTNRKMVYVGTKYSILVISAVVSTIVLLFLLAAAGVTAAGVADFVMNCVALLLMSPYYEEVWYQRLCCLCICCCDRDRRSLRSKAEEQLKAAMEDGTNTSNPPEIDVEVSSKASSPNLASTKSKSVDTYTVEVETTAPRSPSESDTNF